MSKIVKPRVHEIPRSIDRCAFLYLDQCSTNVDGGSIIAWREGKELVVPASCVVCLILGPGSKVTHDVIKLVSNVGTTIVWMGADQTRFYAAGRPLSISARLIESQAKVVSNKRSRMACAKTMYGMRFPGIDVSSKKSMNELRGMEGARMKEIYKREAERVGIEWRGRYAQIDLIDEVQGETSNATINRSLTIGNEVLYAVIRGVLAAINMSPALGVIHCRKAESFVYDVADLYKADTTIPVAFDVMVEGYEDFKTVDRETRRRLRERFRERGLLKRMIADLKFLFLPNEKMPDELAMDELIWVDEHVGLWTKDGVVEGGVNYDSLFHLDLDPFADSEGEEVLES